MKPIKLSEKLKEKIFGAMSEQITKALNSYEFNLDKTKFSFEQSLAVKAKERITIHFTPLAYLRCLEMVRCYSSEIGWYGLIRKIDKRTYQVYDIIVCKQKVNGARVITEDDDMIEFYESLTDEQSEFMHFQAHSHVNMGTTPSAVDVENQMSTVRNMGGKGFYLFQIWNKTLDINSFLYDLDSNIFFDKDDIDVVIDDEQFGTVSGFIDSLKDKVEGMTYTAGTKYSGQYSGQYSGDSYKKDNVKPIESYAGKKSEKDSGKPDKKNEEKEEEEITAAHNSAWYWNDGCGHEGYDC